MAKLPFLAVLLWVGLYSAESPATAGNPSGRLSYVVSYQGLVSMGMRLDIAGAELQLSPAGEEAEVPGRRIQMSVSTRDYSVAETLMPSRFCYRSHLDGGGLATREADWRSRIGSKTSRGSLSFDQTSRQVLRLHAERELEEWQGKGNTVDELAKSAMRPGSEIDSGREEVPFPPGAGPLDRLGMMLWLRGQRLTPGQVLEPAVSNGKQLVGYRLEVEGIEEIEWDGGRRSSYRIRMEPRVNDDKDTYPTWLWLSRDKARLPLLLRSSRAFGSFEARLLPRIREIPLGCDIPETAGLTLPAWPEH